MIDYGCGKGRVDFFLAYQTRCHAIGIEYDQQIFEKAVLNKEKGVLAEKISFVQADAVEYKVPEQVDRFVKVCRSKLNVPARAAEDINV